MEYSKLFEPGKPCFYLTAADIDHLSSKLIFQYPNAVIRTIRGKRCMAVPDFFSEVAAALQFPLYFGENWNAFNDCINDMAWAMGEAYILLVNDASFLLCDADDEDFRVLIKMLSIANEDWTAPNKYFPRSRPVTPFHVVFQCSVSNISAFSSRISQAGAEFETL